MIIQNETWLLRIDPFGAQWTSLFHKPSKKEWLYQSDRAIWPRHAPLLFPIIGKLKENTYTVDGQQFHLTQHGFARENEFEVIAHEADMCQLRLLSDSNTRKLYPFDFELIVTYRCLVEGVEALFEIKNLGHEQMPYNFGGHPGFIIPPSKHTKIKVSGSQDIEKVLLENGFWKKVEKTSETQFAFDQNLNVKDTLLLHNVNRCEVKMQHHTLTMQTSNFPFFALWSPTRDNQHCLCLEPWSGLMDGVDDLFELSQKTYIQTLGFNQIGHHEFKVTITGDSYEKVVD